MDFLSFIRLLSDPRGGTVARIVDFDGGEPDGANPLVRPFGTMAP